MLRLATISLTRPPPTRFDPRPYRATNSLEVHVQGIDGIAEQVSDEPQTDRSEGVSVIWPREHETARVAIAVPVEAGPPEVAGAALVVPDAPRRAAEAAIGEYADVLGVLYQCKRTVRSPQPCVALAASSADEEAQFEDVRTLLAGEGGFPSARVMPLVPTHTLMVAIADRLDGLALLADSLAEDTAVARSRELFRLFERAFRRGPSACVEPLTTFLTRHPQHHALGFTSAEVQFWMENLRAESVHADRRPSFARSPEVEPFLARMEFAAYDVLFNKDRWRQPSAARRSQQVFMSAVESDRRGLVVFQPGAPVMINWIDPWGVFPTDYRARLTLGPEWIWRLPGQDEGRNSISPATRFRLLPPT